MQPAPFHRRRVPRHPGAARAVAWLAVIWLLAPAAGRAADGDPEESLEVAQAEAPASPEDEDATSQPAPERPQPSEQSEEGIEVMHVKGRGVGAIETEVPSSITQFDASTIEALGAQNIADLSRVTPNVNIVQPGATQATFFIRGIGLSDFSSNAAGAVTIFQDDVAIDLPAIQTGQLFDVEGVDIVRGPQGTGPFRNASAGAIRVRGRRPTGNYTAQLRSSIGERNTKGDKGAHDALMQDYEGAVEMPIVSDLLSSRFAFRLRESEPWKTNRCGDALPLSQRLPRPLNTQAGQLEFHNNPRIQMCGEGEGSPPPEFRINTISPIPYGLPDRVNDEHNWAARGTLRFQPRDSEAEFFLNGHGSRLAQDATLGQAVGTRPVGRAGGPISQIVYGGQSQRGYIDKDALEEIEDLCAPNAAGVCSNARLPDIIAKKTAERPLDRGPYAGDYNRVGQDERDAYGAFFSGSGNITEDIKLFGLTSFDQYVRQTDSDTDFTPDTLFEIQQKDRAWQTYNELNLGGELFVQPIEWEVGGYYLREHLENRGLLRTITICLTACYVNRIYTQDLDSLGAWVKFGWEFADDFTLEGGVRYNYETKKFDFTTFQHTRAGDGELAFQEGDTLIPLGNGELIANSVQRETWQTPTGQLILTYHVNQDISAYARYTRGFKAGHFNALASSNLDKPPADEEYNDAWEVGLRGQWFGGLASLGASAFYYRYENYQVFLFTDAADPSTPPVLEILNAKQAENYGVEFDANIAPLRGWTPQFMEGLRVSGNFGWLHGEFLDFTTTRIFALSGAPVVPVEVNYAGQPLQNAPKYKASGAAEWTFDLGRWGYIIPRYDLNWTDDVAFDPNGGRGSIDPTGRAQLPKHAIGQKAYLLHNVRLAYRTPTQNVELAGWIRNVEDEVYKNFAFDASRFTGITINFPGEPRTFGVDVVVTF
jgi:outer membrane receptor protein involved in Fe transport